MTDDRAKQPNPLAPSTHDVGGVAPADGRDGVHYERDADQIVKVVHQVRPASVAVEGPTRERSGEPRDAGASDVAVTPEIASVWEARPADPEES